MFDTKLVVLPCSIDFAKDKDVLLVHDIGTFQHGEENNKHF